MFIDCSEVRSVRIRVELPTLEQVIRNLDFAIKKGEALLSHKVASIHELLAK